MDYKLSDSVLMSRVDILDTFANGKECFQKEQVKEVRTNSNYSYFQGKVLDDDEYLVKIRFKDDGYIKFTSCDCSDYKRSLGDCKHIIGLLFFIREFEKKKNIEKQKELELQNMISKYSTGEEMDRTYLNVEYNLEFVKDEESQELKGANLSIRIGEGRFYLIRDFHEFFQFRNKSELQFGKFFTYNPKVHRFRHKDLYIINYLNRIYENAKYYLGSEGIGDLEGKFIFLSPLLLRQFFDLMEDNILNIKIDSLEYENVEIVRDSLPLEMDIEDKDDNLVVRLYSNEKINILTLDGKYVFIEGKVYRLSELEREKVFPIYDQIALKGQGEVTIPREYREGYISSVLRNVSNYIKLNFSDRVLDMLYEPELQSKIYFDDSKGAITGRVVFDYEGIEINPFSSKDIKGPKRRKILIRNSEGENQILSILEEGYFRVSDGEIYLENNDDIYKLVTDIIPKLQEYSKVYYSENFKSNKIRKKDIKAILNVNERLNVLEFSFNIDGVNLDEIDQIYLAIKKNKKYYRLKDGSFLPLKEDYLKVLKDETNDYRIKSDKDKLILPKYMILLLEDYLGEDFVKKVQLDDSLKELLQNIRISEDMDYRVPKELEHILRSYQKKGFSWLKTMARYGLGGILADDMGLGKTLQVIAFLLSEKKERGRGSSLIVVPTSLVYNWEAEIQKFTGDKLSVRIIQGTKDERIQQLSNKEDYDVIITSYHLLRNDIDLYKDFKFRFCILDEAQNIKNSDSLNARSTKKILAENKFALTGTPMENSVSELWSIFDFLMPGYLLNRKDFVNTYERPIFKEGSKESLEELNKKTKPFILRRLKKDVLKELPDKIEQRILVDMTNKQKEIYIHYINELKQEIEREISQKGFAKSQIKILTSLMRLRQICCDPRLFVEDYTGGSGKLDSLREILQDALSTDHRILIFSQFTSMLDFIEEELKKEGISYTMLTGATPVSARKDIVNDFNQGKSEVMLISLKAGGSGLNLVGADMVIHFDPWWNPAVEEQATDRAYRIGQENTVQVIKLIAKGTIEEKIFSLQEHKKEMIDLVIKEGETLISKLDEDEVLSLFTV